MKTLEIYIKKFPSFNTVKRHCFKYPRDLSVVDTRRLARSYLVVETYVNAYEQNWVPLDHDIGQSTRNYTYLYHNASFFCEIYWKELVKRSNSGEQLFLHNEVRVNLQKK